MPIPDFQTIMLPLLRQFQDGQEHSIRGVLDKLAAEFSLTDQEKYELLPSGTQAVFYNRVGWAKTYLTKSVLLEATGRPFYRITERGQGVLKNNPPRIDMVFLRQFPEYTEFKGRTSTSAVQPAVETSLHNDTDDTSPWERLERAWSDLNRILLDEILLKLRGIPPNVQGIHPRNFEMLVIQLVAKMYDVQFADAMQHLGGSGDGGVDGVIHNDKLRLDPIYVQAKRYNDNRGLGVEDVRAFVGALVGKHADKGIFVTTASFSEPARLLVSQSSKRIALIDGQRLAELMIEYKIGVKERHPYVTMELDDEYEYFS
jgi:restriction system protein